MSVTLTVSEETFKKLQSEAERKGFQSVEQFLDEWKTLEQQRPSRREVVADIRAFHQKMKEKYGVMPNSVEILREDRMRG